MSAKEEEIETMGPFQATYRHGKSVGHNALLDRLRDTLTAHGEPDTIYLIRRLLNEREPGSGEVATPALTWEMQSREGRSEFKGLLCQITAGNPLNSSTQQAVNRFEEEMSTIREILPPARRREIAAQLLTEAPKVGDRAGACLECHGSLVYALPEGSDEPRWVCLTCDEGSYDL